MIVNLPVETEDKVLRGDYVVMAIVLMDVNKDHECLVFKFPSDKPAEEYVAMLRKFFPYTEFIG